MTETSTPFKTFTIVNTSKSLLLPSFECQNISQTFLWFQTDISTTSSVSPWFVVRSQSATGPILAAVTFQTNNHGPRIALGDPQDSSQLSWSGIEVSKSGREVGFTGPDGRPYVWRSTHNTDIGASRWTAGDRKLLDIDAGEKILGVFITTKATRDRFDWMVELHPNMELFAMAVILTDAMTPRNVSSTASSTTSKNFSDDAAMMAAAAASATPHPGVA